MEACLLGEVTIAELLFSKGASVTSMNDDRWTAVDFLKNYLDKHQELDSGKITKIKALVNKMECKQINCKQF